jgi:single-stranded-DNA-specific exonuclease
MTSYADSISDCLGKLKQFLSGLRGNVVILSHVDADGLCAATLFKRFLGRRGIATRHTWPAKGENGYSLGTVDEVKRLQPEALIVLDLGVMAEEIAPGVPTIFVDHHRPFGRPKEAVVISSYGNQPAHPTSFLAYDLLSRLGRIEDFEWLGLVGTAGDLGGDFAGAHLTSGARKHTKTSIKEAEVLINSAKRSSTYDISTAARILDGAEELTQVTDHNRAEVRLLEKYRAEVNAEVRRCRHERPHFSWKVAMVPFESRCEIQGLIAETWRRQLENYLVIAANFGYLEGKVAYVIRTELQTSVIDFMESLRPGGLDSHVAFGHDRAAGAVLDKEIWSQLVARMRFSTHG